MIKMQMEYIYIYIYIYIFLNLVTTLQPSTKHLQNMGWK